VDHGRSAPVLPRGGLDDSDGNLEGIVIPGDVLFVRGSGGLLELGTAGGVLGHVMLVVKAPERVGSTSEHARYLKSVWPSGGVTEIWKVRTVESSRGRSGLHEAELYLYVERKTRRLQLLGELGDGEFDISNEATELWQSPAEVRSRLCDQLVQEVLNEMRVQGARANWSWTTAARAVLRADDNLNLCSNKGQLIQEIQECWAMDPICTSVVIHFWQRCLCKLAKRIGSSQNGARSKPVDLILQWMPLKADRSLPGILLDTMRRCGWTKRTTITAPRRQGQGHALPQEPSFTPAISRMPTSPGAPSPTSPCARAAPTSPGLPGAAPAVARYCSAHDTTHKRGKVEPRYQECSACRTTIQTNYAALTLCPPCSERQDRCMICGLSCGCSTPDTCNGRPAPNSQAGGAAVGDESVLRAPTPQLFASADPVAPLPAAAARYCSGHSRTEKRVKTEPRLRECTACHVHVQTNYLDFTLCPLCSEKCDRCLLCGAAASEARSFVPAQLTVSTEEQQGTRPTGGVPAMTTPASAPASGDSVPPLPVALSVPAAATSGLVSPGDVVIPPPLPAAQSQLAQVPPRYCSMHNRTEKRAKGEARLRECAVCRVQIQTNYLDFALCPPCSEMREQCMICGLSAAEPRSFVPPPLPSKGDEHTSRPCIQGQIPPRFCCMHDATQKRPKTEPKFRECTSCRVKVQTNYADFALCPPCSDKENRCMLCGSSAKSTVCCMLPSNTASAQPLPSLLSRHL